MRWHSEGFLERSREVSLGDAADSRQPPHRPLLLRGRVHAVTRTQQAAQEIGVLVGHHGRGFYTAATRTGTWLVRVRGGQCQ